jgi:hypothetical protein
MIPFTRIIQNSKRHATDKDCATGSVPLFTPATANAATEAGNGTMYVSAGANGAFTITHARSATTGRTFLYVLPGILAKHAVAPGIAAQALEEALPDSGVGQTLQKAYPVVRRGLPVALAAERVS